MRFAQRDEPSVRVRGVLVERECGFIRAYPGGTCNSTVGLSAYKGEPD